MPSRACHGVAPNPSKRKSHGRVHGRTPPPPPPPPALSPNSPAPHHSRQPPAIHWNGRNRSGGLFVFCFSGLRASGKPGTAVSRPKTQLCCRNKWSMPLQTAACHVRLGRQDARTCQAACRQAAAARPRVWWLLVCPRPNSSPNPRWRSYSPGRAQSIQPYTTWGGIVTAFPGAAAGAPHNNALKVVPKANAPSPRASTAWRRRAHAAAMSAWSPTRSRLLRRRASQPAAAERRQQAAHEARNCSRQQHEMVGGEKHGGGATLRPRPSSYSPTRAAKSDRDCRTQNPKRHAPRTALRGRKKLCPQTRKHTHCSPSKTTGYLIFVHRKATQARCSAPYTHSAGSRAGGDGSRENRESREGRVAE